MNKYYMPTIENFKQGFEYEYRLHSKGDKTGGIVYLNSDTPTKDFFAKEDEWVKRKVWWNKRAEMKTIEYDDGFTVTYMEHQEFDLDYMWDVIKRQLEDGRIRVEK